MLSYITQAGPYENKGPKTGSKEQRARWRKGKRNINNLPKSPKYRYTMHRIADINWLSMYGSDK